MRPNKTDFIRTLIIHPEAAILVVIIIRLLFYGEITYRKRVLLDCQVKKY